jgi:hypothetical protein
VKLGHERYFEGIPLSELIFALSLTKSMLVDFIRHCVPGRPEELNLEYDLVISIGEFFDEAIFFAATGYEDAYRAQLNAPHKTESIVVIPGEKRGPLPDNEALDEDWAISRGGQIGEASG